MTEIQVSASLEYTNPAKAISAKSLSVLASLFSITGEDYVQGTKQVPTTAGGTAIPLGSLASRGWAMFQNHDLVNYVDLYTGVGGTLFARLYPGEIALFRFHPNVTAPAAIAHLTTVNLEYLILEN